MAAGQLDEAVGVLREVKAAGLRCLALSNMEPSTFAARRTRFAFMDWFDGFVISGVEGVAKPDRRIFQILLRRYRLEPATTVFIDDSAANVEAASGLGMIAVRYTSARQLRGQLRSLGLTVLGVP
jgi:2-haloacid dehalogenase